MSAFRMNGQLQNSRNTLKILYANQVGNTDTGDAMNEVVYVTPSGPASSPNFTVMQNQNDLTSPCLVNIVGTLAQGVGTEDANVSAAGNAVLGWRNSGRHVEIGSDSSNMSYIDFHSKELSTQDFDTRLISIGGDTANPGKATFLMQSAKLDLSMPTIEKACRIESYYPFDSGFSYNRRDFTVNKYYYSGVVSGDTTQQIFFSTSGGYFTLQMSSKSGKYNIWATAFAYVYDNNAGVTGEPRWYVTSPAIGPNTVNISGNAAALVTVTGNVISVGGQLRALSFTLKGELPVGNAPPAVQILASTQNLTEDSYYVIEYTQNINSN